MTFPFKFWHVYCCHIYFFSARFQNMCKPETTFCLVRWVTCLACDYTKWRKQTGSVPCDLIFARKLNLSFLWAVPLNQLFHLPSQPAPYNQLLIKPLALVSEYNFTQKLSVRVLKFQSIFSQNLVFIGCNFFL